jgi:hypothetical protein
MFTVRLLNSESAISAETDSFESALAFISDLAGCPQTHGSGWQSKEDHWEMMIYNWDECWGPHEPSAIAQILAAPGFVPPAGTIWPPNKSR